MLRTRRREIPLTMTEDESAGHFQILTLPPQYGHIGLCLMVRAGSQLDWIVRGKIHYATDPRAIGGFRSIGQFTGEQKHAAIVIGVHLPGEGELPVVGHAGDILRFQLGLGQNRQQKCGEDCDNGNNHQQFDQRKSPRVSASCLVYANEHHRPGNYTTYGRTAGPM